MIYVTSNKDRFCLNCSFAKFIGDRFFCPFIEGSCVRVPGTVKRTESGQDRRSHERERIFQNQ